MGSTNTTANYGLSQFVSTDKPAWLQDYNGDMLKIDTGINAAKLAADSAALDAGAAQSDATAANTAISGTITPAISALQTTVGNQGGSINTINALIGNGTPTTTDQTIIGAINEINAKVTNIESWSPVTGVTAGTNTTISNNSLVKNDNLMTGSIDIQFTGEPSHNEILASGLPHAAVTYKFSRDVSNSGIVQRCDFAITTTGTLLISYPSGSYTFTGGMARIDLATPI